MADLTNLERETVIRKMTFKEARQCADEIKTGINSIGQKLLQLYEGDGWKALGYSSWRECGQVEFGFKQSHVYRLLDAAEVERNISPNGGNLQIAERQARPLVSLPPDAQREVWQVAVETAPGGKVTAAHVQATVEIYQLAQNESVIDSGMQEFVITCNALREIRDTRLYRQAHGTFESYCREKWGIEQSYADELIGFAQVIGN